MFTFTVVPVQYRVAWVSCMQVGWNAFVSGLNEGARTQQAEAASVPPGAGAATGLPLTPAEAARWWEMSECSPTKEM